MPNFQTSLKIQRILDEKCEVEALRRFNQIIPAMVIK